MRRRLILCVLTVVVAMLAVPAAWGQLATFKGKITDAVGRLGSDASIERIEDRSTHRRPIMRPRTLHGAASRRHPIVAILLHSPAGSSPAGSSPAGSSPAGSSPARVLCVGPPGDIRRRSE